MKIILVLLGSLFFISCQQKKQEQPLNEEEVKEHMIHANQILIHKESEDIRDFIKRHGWNMQESGTGLRYEIYQEGKGDRPAQNSLVSVAYSLYLLDGTFCYQADSLKPLTFMLGKAQQPRGLEEGIGMMKEGGKARLVIPAHLGFGLAGDENKIPGGSVLVYEVTLVKINHD
jgi:FKBP-type peptidyl-prolyl cis-trans isomerase